MRLHVDIFQPVQKLLTRVRVGIRIRRVYDRAQTPYQRLCATGILKPEPREQLDRRLTPPAAPTRSGCRLGAPLAPGGAHHGNRHF